MFVDRMTIIIFRMYMANIEKATEEDASAVVNIVSTERTLSYHLNRI